MRIFEHNVIRGKKTTFKVSLASYPNGDPISLHIRVCNGAMEGPRIALLGVQHGDEYSGMEIINRIIDDMNPSELSGSLVTVPVSNPLAFNTAGRITPPAVGYENLNMNRVWPGNPKGLLMERLVSDIWNHIVKDSDYVIDLHEGGKVFMARYIHARGTNETEKLIGPQNQKLYSWFGQGVPVLGGVRTQSHMMGSLSIQTGLRGIPCIGPELGGGGILWEELVRTGVQGIKNILIGQDMIQEEPVGQKLTQHVARESTWPKTNQGGFMYNTCELGDIVEKGDVLGQLRDTTGKILEELIAPYKSVIFDTRFLPTVYPGDWTFHCGRLK